MSTILADDRSRQWDRHGAGHRLLLAMATAAALTAVAPLQTAGVPWLARAVEFTTAALVWEVAMVAARAVLLRTALVDRPTTVLGLVIVVVTASVPATATIALILTASGERIGPLASFYAGSLLLGLLVAFARRGLRFGSSSSVEHAADRPSLETAAPSPDETFLRSRAPRLAGGRLLALEAEDHYLRVHTDRVRS